MFLKYRPRDSPGCWDTSQTHTCPYKVYSPVEKADSVAYAGLEEVLGARENMKEAPKSAFQRKSGR